MFEGNKMLYHLSLYLCIVLHILALRVGFQYTRHNYQLKVYHVKETV